MEAESGRPTRHDREAGRALLLCGHPKSGTSLLLSLLDGHPDIVALPEETKYFRAIHGHPELMTAQALLERTRVGRLSRDRETARQQGRDFADVDAARFEREIERRIADGCAPQELLPAVALAYAAATGREAGRYWAEKTPLQEHHLDVALELWPDLRAIYVVRDPRDVHVSFQAKRLKRGRRLGVVQSALRIRASLRAWATFQAREPSRCWTVRYEELVRRPEATMRLVADFLEIDWRPELLVPTLAGRDWAGNSMFAEQHSQISESPIGRHTDGLSAGRSWLLSALLADEFCRYGWSREP